MLALRRAAYGHACWAWPGCGSEALLEKHYRVIQLCQEVASYLQLVKLPVEAHRDVITQ